MIGAWDVVRDQIPMECASELPVFVAAEQAPPPIVRLTRICRLLASAAEARRQLLAEADKLERALDGMLPPQSAGARPAYEMAREGLLSTLEAVDWLLDSWGQEPGEFEAALGTLLEGDRLLDRAEEETERLNADYPLVA